MAATLAGNSHRLEAGHARGLPEPGHLVEALVAGQLRLDEGSFRRVLSLVPIGMMLVIPLFLVIHYSYP